MLVATFLAGAIIGGTVAATIMCCMFAASEADRKEESSNGHIEER